ncbi:EAL domain-containing protein [Enterobacter hormaechei]
MFAHEVLVEIHNVNLEVLFASLPSRSALQIFFWQANTLLQIPARDAYWLNLPAEHLLNERAIRLLLALRHQQRLTIEIQDPLTITRLSEDEQRRLHATLVRLKEAGWQIWLDDLTRELAEAFARLALPLDGVKIDRSALRERAPLAPFVQEVRASINSILIEGIENSRDLARARASGAQSGQGFLWPESRTDARVTL